MCEFGIVQEIAVHSHAVVLHACQRTLQTHPQSVGDVRIDVVVVVVDDHQIVEVCDNKHSVVQVRDQAIQVRVQMVEVLEHVSRYTSPLCVVVASRSEMLHCCL